MNCGFVEETVSAHVILLRMIRICSDRKPKHTTLKKRLRPTEASDGVLAVIVQSLRRSEINSRAVWVIENAFSSIEVAARKKQFFCFLCCY